STGPTEYNQRLSERRAEKVKSLLIDKGIAEDRLNTLGEGEKMPTASNTTKEGRAANRRIEVELGQ
ncbi:MAG: OmpA family protein, partial [Sulfuricurvum sp.]